MRSAVVIGGVAGAAVLFAAGFGTGFVVKDGDSKPTAAAVSEARVITPAAPTTAAPTKATTNIRGAIVKKWGQNAGLGCETTPCDVEFVVSAPIEPTQCSSSYQPKNGRLVALPIVAETRAGGDLSQLSGMWNPNNFSAVKASGVTQPAVTSAATYGCAESEKSVPDRMAPASRYEGFVVLDIPTDTTAIQFIPSQSDGGWEWPLP